MSLQPYIYSILIPLKCFARQVAGPATPPLPPPLPPPSYVKEEQQNDDPDADREWSEEEWRAWENWDGYEEVKEEIVEEDEEGEEDVGSVGGPQYQPEEEDFEDVERETKRSKYTSKDAVEPDGWDDKSWIENPPWQWSSKSWSGWGWKDYGKESWSHRDWSYSGASSSSQSPRHQQKAPWAFGSKGKGRGKKGKTDRFGGTYVRGGYIAPDSTFYK